MAGFYFCNGTSDYDVPRSLIKYPLEWRYLLFPSYNKWIQQHQSIHGDKGKGAVIFVFHVIPLFCDAIIQDGIYWVTQFSHHEYSLCLLSTIPDYMKWATLQIKTIASRESIHLNSTSSNTNSNEKAYPKSSSIANFVEKNAMCISPSIKVSNMKGNESPTEFGINMSLPVDLCPSVLLIYRHWSSHKLDDLLQKQFRRNWSNDLENRYKKRKYTLQCIKVHAERNQVSLNTAAIQIDGIRTEMGFNTSKYSQYFKK